MPLHGKRRNQNPDQPSLHTPPHPESEQPTEEPGEADQALNPPEQPPPWPQSPGKPPQAAALIQDWIQRNSH